MPAEPTTTRQRADWTDGQAFAFACQVSIAAMTTLVTATFGPRRTLGIILLAFVSIVFLGCLRHGLGRWPR